MKRILCLAHKDFVVLVGDKSNLFWVFGFPVVFALFFGLIFANTGGGDGPKDMEVGLVDQDQSELSQEYAARLDAEDALRLTPMTLEDAQERIRKGKLPAALIIKDSFSENNGMAFGTDEPIIQIMTDPSRQMQSAYLKGLAAKAQFEGFSTMFSDPDRAKENFQAWRDGIAQDPDMDPLLAATFLTMFDSMETFTEQLNLQEGENELSDDFMSIDTISVEREIEKGKSPVHGFQVTFPQCILWGIMGCAATFAVSLVKEKTSGTLARLCVGPIRKSHILAGKGLACFATCSMVMVFLSLLAKLLFKVPIDSFPNFVLACICVNICFVGLMMFVCTLGKTEQFDVGHPAAAAAFSGIDHNDLLAEDDRRKLVARLQAGLALRALDLGCPDVLEAYVLHVRPVAGGNIDQDGDGVAVIDAADDRAVAVARPGQAEQRQHDGQRGAAQRAYKGAGVGLGFHHQYGSSVETTRLVVPLRSAYAPASLRCHRPPPNG